MQPRVPALASLATRFDTGRLSYDPASETAVRDSASRASLHDVTAADRQTTRSMFPPSYPRSPSQAATATGSVDRPRADRRSSPRTERPSNRPPASNTSAAPAPPTLCGSSCNATPSRRLISRIDTPVNQVQPPDLCPLLHADHPASSSPIDNDQARVRGRPDDPDRAPNSSLLSRPSGSVFNRRRHRQKRKRLGDSSRAVKRTGFTNEEPSGRTDSRRFGLLL